MQKKLALFAASILFMFSSSAQTQITAPAIVTPPGGTTNNNFNVVIHNDTSPNISTQLDNTNNVWSETTVQNWMQQINIDQKVQQAYDKSQAFVCEYKKQLLLGFAACAYGWLCYKVLQGSSFIHQEEAWASWPNKISFDELITMPQDKLAQQLLHEIQRCYTDQNNPTDFVTPLIKFMSEINTEIRLTAQYNKLYSWLAWLRITAILPMSTKHFKMLPQRNRHLVYLKNTFTSWAADYKIVHNKYDTQIESQENALNKHLMQRLIATHKD